MAVAIPKEAKIKHEGQRLAVQGPNGKLDIELPKVLKLSVSDKEIKVERSGNSKPVKAAHGLYRALIANMVEGATKGFKKELEITGVGYRAQLSGKQLVLNVGLSHQVKLDVPEGLTVETPKPTLLSIKGANRWQVGQFAAVIRRVSPPEPYKGKGIKFSGETIRRKAGKAATGSGAKA